MRMKLTSILVPMTFLVFLSIQQVQAQTVNAGAWMIGGDAYFTSTSIDGVDDNINLISINPNVGYFIMDNLGVGVRLGVDLLSQGDNSQTDFGIGAFARYYVFQGLFPQVGFTYNSFKIKDGPDATTSTDLTLGVGYSLFLNNSIALEPMLVYNINSEKVNTFGLGIGIQAFLGRD